MAVAIAGKCMLIVGQSEIFSVVSYQPNNLKDAQHFGHKYA